METKKVVLNVKALSVNSAWKGGARYRTEDYKEFEQEVFYQLPRFVMIKGEVEMNYKFYIKNYSRTDVSNLLKCLEDILVKAKIIEDDRFVVKLSAEKIKSEKEKIEIEIIKK